MSRTIKTSKDDAGPSIKLIPITPAHSNRYTKNARAHPKSRNIPARIFTSASPPETPQYLPLEWTEHIQPEGQLYFYHSVSGVLTEARIYDVEVRKRLALVIQAVQSILLELNQKLPPFAELFLQHNEDDDIWGYYFVDHATQTEFWLDGVTSDEVDIPDTVSEAQLHYVLKEHYWNHVEYFPMHRNVVKVRLVRELNSILGHGRTDNLTSSVSTFPFNASQCSDFQGQLRDCIPRTASDDDIICDGYTTCFIARIWSQINRHRFIHFYGEGNARLSRDQRMLETDAIKSPLILRACIRLLFNEPERYLTELDTLWVDELVCIDPWKAFVSSCLSDWKESVSWSLAVLLAHILFKSADIGSSAVAIGSIAFTIAGVISGVVLTHYHRMPLNLQAFEAANFLTNIYHPVLGFQPLAIVYSLPKAVLFWSTTLLSLQASLEVIDSTEQSIALGVLCSLALIGCVVVAVLRRGSNGYDSYYEGGTKTTFFRRLFCLPRKRSDKGEYEA